MDLISQFVWNLYIICKSYPNATGYVAGGVVGIICMGWYTRKLIISQFERYLGNNQALIQEIAVVKVQAEHNTSDIAEIKKILHI